MCQSAFDLDSCRAEWNSNTVAASDTILVTIPTHFLGNDVATLEDPEQRIDQLLTEEIGRIGNVQSEPSVRVGEKVQRHWVFTSGGQQEIFVAVHFDIVHGKDHTRSQITQQPRRHTATRPEIFRKLFFRSMLRCPWPPGRG